MPANRRRTGLIARSGRKSGVKVGAPEHDPEFPRQIEQAGFDSRPDVVDAIGRGRTSGQQIGPSHISNVDEIHGLTAIAEYHGWLADIQAFHPADQYFCVFSVQIHARSIDVEIAQSDVVQAMHVIECTEQALVEQLGRPVKRAIVVWVMCSEVGN